jgi:hypothetical protein
MTTQRQAERAQRQAQRAVITVGEGRGFVVEGRRDYLVITTGHCLPFVPPCDAYASCKERTYPNLLGPLGEAPTVSAECQFINPVADIAVLGPPDRDAAGYEKWDAYRALLADMVALPILATAPEEGTALLLSLSGNWFECIADQTGGMLWLSNAAEPIQGGMSGSPVLTPAGACIGIIGNSPDDERRDGNASLQDRDRA